jgi:MinD-like ATPase involved in chromosome partitioning or flagellar assembly
MGKVISLTGQAPEADIPSPELIETLESLLADAKAGLLQSLVATGQRSDGQIMVAYMWSQEVTSLYELLGAIKVMEAELTQAIICEDD